MENFQNILENTLWRAIGQLVVVFLVNVVVLYFAFWQKQRDHDKEIRDIQKELTENKPAAIDNKLNLEIQRINTLTRQLEKLEENVDQRLGKKIEDKIVTINERLTELSQDIEVARNTLSKGNNQIKFIELEARTLSYQYKELTPILDTFNNLKDEHDNIQTVGKLLEIVDNNSDASSIITQLKTKVSEVEIKQKSQPIIKIGRIGLKHHKGFIQTEELQNGNGERCKKIEVEFNDKDDKDKKFSSPSDVKFRSPPHVYVALAMVDGQYNGECEIPSLKFGCNTKVHVFAESVTEEKFTLKVITWDRSKIWNIDAIWIAIGN